MRQASLLVVIAALLCAGTAAAGGPGLKNLPIKVAAKRGKVAVFAFSVNVKLPPGTTISGGSPISVHSTNSGQLARGTLAAAAVHKTGATSWELVVVVDSRKASGPGASTVTANVQVPPPYSLNPVSAEKEPDPCAEYKRIRDSLNSNVAGAAFAIWLILGPTDQGKEIMLSGHLDCY